MQWILRELMSCSLSGRALRIAVVAAGYVAGAWSAAIGMHFLYRLEPPMSVTLRFCLAALSAAFGSALVYLGALTNALALGGTWGGMFFVPGIALIALAQIPVIATSLQAWQAILLRALRCLSLPVFLLSFFTLVPVVWDSLGASAERVYGLYEGVGVTVLGLLAIAWPELSEFVVRWRVGRSLTGGLSVRRH